ncbi:hypothetical protein EI94DRAFT_1759248 [Lactarius quietus]|nr:hypothetical protein EI94DRAFT_1759248 [Lactarius quietus]
MLEAQIQTLELQKSISRYWMGGLMRVRCRCDPLMLVVQISPSPGKTTVLHISHNA